jgi:hypothetical protein
VPRTMEPSIGCSCTLAKQKYEVPSGIIEYWRVICDGLRKARCTAHLPHEPPPLVNLMPVPL